MKGMIGLESQTQHPGERHRIGTTYELIVSFLSPIHGHIKADLNIGRRKALQAKPVSKNEPSTLPKGHKSVQIVPRHSGSRTNRSFAPSEVLHLLWKRWAKGDLSSRTQ